MYAVSLKDRELAMKFIGDFVNHTVEHEAAGAPFEWKTADTEKYEGAFYGASAALPLQAVRRIFS